MGFGLRQSEAERRAILQHYVEMVGVASFERAYPRRNNP